MQIITPGWLFERAGVTTFGIVEWRQKVPERGPGVYVITSNKPPTDGQPVVYVGRTKHLRRRLREFYKHKYGERAPHSGGQSILNLPGTLTVCWAAAADYAGAEKIMLEAFRAIAGKWPYGNRMKSAVMASISN